MQLTNINTTAPKIAEPLPMIRVDLVRAFKLGLTLKQAVTLSVIHQIIKTNAVPFVDLAEERWWYIDGEAITQFSPLVADHPSRAMQHLLALQLCKLIEINEIDNMNGTRFILRMRTNLILSEG